MRSLPYRAQRQPIPHPEPFAADALIYLGRLETDDKMRAVLRAIDKVMRLGQRRLSLILADRAGGANDAPSAIGGPCTLSPRELGDLLDTFGAQGRLLLPCRNEHFGDVFLHALASGVPLDAINYRSASDAEVASLSRSGASFIATRSIPPRMDSSANYVRRRNCSSP